MGLATTAGMVALTVATGGLGGAGIAAKVAEGAAEAAKVGEGVETAAKTAMALSRTERFAKGFQEVKTGISEARGAEKIDKLMTAGRDIKGVAREAIGMNPASYVQRGRTALAERMLPGVEEGTAGGFQKSIFRHIEGGPGLARESAQTAWSNASTRIAGVQGGTLGRINQARQFSANVKAVGDVTQALAHPEDAALHLGTAAFEHYKPQLENAAIKYGGKALLHSVMGGGDKEEGPAQPYSPYTQAAPLEQPKLTDFRLGGTRSTMASRRRPGQQAALGTVTKDDTMPTQIGPNDWYGPQQGYSAGRGFQANALPSLEQPRPMGQMTDDTLGV
jgi:hypothetical protein